MTDKIKSTLASKPNFSSVLANNARTVMIIISFVGTMYIQNEINTVRIQDIQKSIMSLEIKQEESYKKIDAIKLDKEVFSATMSQMQPIRDDLKELRSDIKEILKTINHTK